MGRPSYEEGTSLIFSETESGVAGVLACIIAIAGAVGNVLTIVALVYSKRLRWHPTTMFLVSLSLSDLIFSVYNLPLTAHRFFNRGCEFMCLDWHVCKYFPFFFYGNLGVSIYIMALVALHRVFGVFRGPSLNKYFNKMTVPGMIVLVWAGVFGMMMFPLTEHWGQFGFEPLTSSCTLVESEGETFMPAISILGVALPFIFISVSYIAIYCKVKITGQTTKRASANDSSLLQITHKNDFRKQIKDRERELTNTLLFIFLGFLFCFLPFSVLSVVDPMPPSRNSVLHLISYVLTWSSCCINPVIYCATNKYYFEAYKTLLVDLLGFTRTSSRATETTAISAHKSSLRAETTAISAHKSSLRAETTSISANKSSIRQQDLTELENLFQGQNQNEVEIVEMDEMRQHREIIQTTRL